MKHEDEPLLEKQAPLYVYLSRRMYGELQVAKGSAENYRSTHESRRLFDQEAPARRIALGDGTIGYMPSYHRYIC